MKAAKVFRPEALLDARWALCCQPAARADGKPPGPGCDWIEISHPQPVAAALQALGRFSLDKPDRSFDDEIVWYCGQFDWPDGEAETYDAELVFDGLATVADVWLNGEHVLHAHNMFRQWTVSLAGRMRAQGNRLLLRFDALNMRLAERRPRPRWRVPMLEQQQLRWWRTTLLGRTPGWSPPVAVVGPWLPIWIRRPGAAGPEVHRQRAWLDGTTGRYQLVLDMQDELRHGAVVLRREDVALRARLVQVESDSGALQLMADLHVEQAQPWWPHTHGTPALYEASIEWTDAQGRLQCLVLGRIGFRRIEVDTRDAGFAIDVNGEPVFCRGACWTPLDPLRLRAEPAAYDDAVRQLRDAGMNMLRIVGAMAWESRALFEACDRHGVMVWQDLMLANMDYPADDAAFLEDLRIEVLEQLSALQAHPCLALVCGNSEVAQQAAMWGAEPGHWRQPLFDSVLPQWVAEVLDVAYWPSSACGGDFPHQPGAGSCSYYGVGAYRRGIDDARHSGLRFASECLAFANIPSDDALARLPAGPGALLNRSAWKSRVPRDLGAAWDFDDVRDFYVELLLGAGRADSVRATDRGRYLALGRAASAETMARAFDQWRASDSRCGGALVWFLRDLWPGAGWGILDDKGRPKSAFHALARVLQPVWLGWIDDGLNGLQLHWANESARDIHGMVKARAWRHGDHPVARGELAVQLPARGRGRIPLPELFGAFIDLNWAYRFGPRVAEAVHAQLVESDGQGSVLASAITFVPQLASRCAPIGLEARAAHSADGSVQLHVSTRALALGVHFEATGWTPSDEYFHLAPGEGRIVRFTRIPSSKADDAPWSGCVTALNTHELVTP